MYRKNDVMAAYSEVIPDNIRDQLKAQLKFHKERAVKIEEALQLLDENPVFERLQNLLQSL